MKEYICKYCGKKFKKKGSCINHEKHWCNSNNNLVKLNHYYEKENKVCPFCGKEWLTTNSGFYHHQVFCKENPNKKEFKPHTLTEETRKKISSTMKKAISEGRANGWKSRKRCEHSYPEKWFISTLKNNFNMEEGKDYVCELSFHNFFLDFAWIDKKFCVEIDGEQHHRFQDRIKKDQEKDLLLKEEGWTEIRADWKYICNNKKEFIDNFFSILNSLDSKNENPKKYSFLGHRDLRDYEEREKLKSEGRIDSLGRVSKKVTSEKEWEERKKLILDSGVDLNKFGYVEKVVRTTGLTKRQVRNTILKYNIEHFEKNV